MESLQVDRTPVQAYWWTHSSRIVWPWRRCVTIDKNEILVDRFDSETGTIYQFYGRKWHGCPCLGIANDKYHRTMNVENQIRSLGHNVVSVWEWENPEFSKNCLEGEFVPYPHYIVYDFEVVLKKKDLNLTSDLTIDCSHILISIAINDILTKEPIFIENGDPEVLIEEHVKELVCRQEIISEVWKMYLTEDVDSLLERVQSRWTTWVNQVPMFSFNSGKYDLKLVKYCFVKTISNMSNINVMKKDNP